MEENLQVFADSQTLESIVEMGTLESLHTVFLFLVKARLAMPAA